LTDTDTFKLELKTKENIRLECMDCFTGIRSLDPDSISLIVTSPPYNLGDVDPHSNGTGRLSLSEPRRIPQGSMDPV